MWEVYFLTYQKSLIKSGIVVFYSSYKLWGWRSITCQTFGQTSDWRKINSGVPQGSVLGPLLFLIFINDLPDGITSLCNIFADDTSLFSKVYDIDTSAKELNSDLEKISKWAFQWKMQFNSDPNKQANEVISSRKTNNSSHPSVAFNNNVIKRFPYHKYLGTVLDSKLEFKFQVDQKLIN